MHPYRNSLIWTAAVLTLAVAGRLNAIDGQAVTSLLIGLFAVSPMMMRGRASCVGSARVEA